MLIRYKTLMTYLLYYPSQSGHVIGFGYIKPDPAKIEALFHYPPPYTLTQLQKSFNTIRNLLTSDSVLALPDPNKRFRLDTDAGNTGVGAVLSQEKEKIHTNADALSRWPLPIDDEEVQAQKLQHIADETEPKLVINLIDITQNEPEPQLLEITPVEQDKDQCINWIKNLIRENGEKRPEIDQFSSNFHKRLYEFYEQLSCCFTKTLGTNFQSELLRKIYDLLDIHQLKTTAFHPESDGLTERFNRTLKTMIACYVNENQNNWDKLLPFLSFAYNTSTHSTTNHSPYEVIYYRKPKIRIDLIIAKSAENIGEGEVTVEFNTTETKTITMNIHKLTNM
ncbi:unnamed protein product [Brachionus calyciflorus]|uniref:Integrase catalytic domain-containing protein n=1 Tax=Brachionus calyciflorus TaxID=104777 RepID=A0A813TCG7_9BILA|nr:unnamed protein product [Brachionus calyciflorus]